MLHRHATSTAGAIPALVAHDARLTLTSVAVKLLYVGPVAPIQGGIAQHGGRLIEALRRAGHQVTVATWRSQYPRALYKGTRVHRSDFSGEDQPLLSWWNPYSWWKVRRLARHHDRVLIQWVHPFHAPPIRTIAGGARERTVVLVHNARPHEYFPMADRLTRWALARVAKLILHSSEQADLIHEIADPHEVAVVPHPPNLDVEDVAPAPDPPWVLLFAGYVREYKGPDIAIRALQTLRDRGIDAHLRMLGSFWEPESRYRELADDLDVGDHVTMTNRYATDAELASAMTACHVFLAPYRTATQSGLIPIALAAGRPVVASDIAGLADQLPEGTASLAQPGNADSFADAVEQLLGRYEEARSAAQDSAPRWDSIVAEVVAGSSGAEK